MNFPFSHVTIGANDIERAKVFYDAALAPLGLVRSHTDPEALGYRASDSLFDRTPFWIMKPFNGEAAHHGNGWHFAFNAASQEHVNAFHAAALAHGGTDEGPPGLRPQYDEGYYAAYVRDPEGNKLQAVHHGDSQT